MKITYRWLNEFVALEATPAELAQQLTLAGLEVESVAPVAPPFSGVVVGEVLEAARHPQADKLSVCTVTTDGSDRLQIICGAPNVRAGLRVAVAMVGAQLPGEVTIRRAKLRGLESQGMLCSARELGLGTEHDGILELAPQLLNGTDLRAALDLDDNVLEINATPNRGDCLSVFGIARDHAAARQRRHLRPAATAVPATLDATFPVRIEAPRDCPLFTCRVIRGLRAGARSPEWLRERLRRVGINSISAAVDVTNYVMMELGQPLHAFDLRTLAGGIVVRHATGAERISLLNDEDYLLDAGSLVIADSTGPIGLAGIMGGRRTAISDSTTEVLLECAHFVPDAIAGRARGLGLFTDAAQRFERGVDPSLPPLAIERATALLLDIAGGQAGAVQITRGADAGVRPDVPLRRERVVRLLGTRISDDDIGAILRAIGDRVESTPSGWSVTIPPHRFDLRIEADLIEEVARLYGYDRIEEKHAVAPQIAGAAGETQVARERVLAAFADRGYREVITYSFVDPALQRQLFPDTPALELANPISAELSAMRVSLWPGLIHACRENLRRQQGRVRLFELGRKFQGVGPELREIDSLAGIVTGARWPEQWGLAREPADFYDVKADLCAVLELTGKTELHFKPFNISCLRPGRSAQILRGDTLIGWLGELHPGLVRTLNLPQAPLLFDLEYETAFMSNTSQYKGISKFPSVRRDLAIVVDESVSLAAVQENVSVSASGLLSDLRVFDIYRGPGIDSGRKSIALGLILQDSSRTLTDVDADAVVTAVVARLRDVLSATIRDR